MKRPNPRWVVIVLGVAVASVLACDDPIEQIIRSNIYQQIDRNPDAILDDPGIHVIIAGSGSPRNDADRSASCTAVIAGGEFLVFDPAENAIRQLDVFAYPIRRISKVFITHMHADHTFGLDGLINSSWIFGREGPDPENPSPLDIYGPNDSNQYQGYEDIDYPIPGVEYSPGITHYVTHLNECLQSDRIARQTSQPQRPYVASFGNPIPIADMGPDGIATVYENTQTGLLVEAFQVVHEPNWPSFGYRVSYGGRTVVISGDVEWCGDPDDPIDDPRCDNVTTYAQGVDVLVHEAYSQYLIDLVIDVALTDFDPPREDVAELTRNAVDHHTPALEVAQVAAAASVGQLVLTHIIPPTPHHLLKDKFVEGMDAIYSGPIVLADDGTDIYLP
jgi:ribonuclease Z